MTQAWQQEKHKSTNQAGHLAMDTPHAMNGGGNDADLCGLVVVSFHLQIQRPASVATAGFASGPL